MAKNGFRVLDSDIHIIEPPDLWARYIDAPFKHQAPRGFADWVLDLRIEIDGKLMPANVTYSAEARGRSAQRDRERFRPTVSGSARSRSAAGAPKRSSRPWTRRASTLRSSIQHGGSSLRGSTGWSRSWRPRSPEPTTIGSTTSAP